MSHARLLEIGRDLSSRERARALREQFLAGAGTDPTRLVFDFAGVRTLSDSFADELIAVLVTQRGAPWFKEHVSIENASPEFRRVILSAVYARLKRQAGEAPPAASP